MIALDTITINIDNEKLVMTNGLIFIQLFLALVCVRVFY